MKWVETEAKIVFTRKSKISLKQAKKVLKQLILIGKWRTGRDSNPRPPA
jgi:hypothetical protein